MNRSRRLPALSLAALVSVATACDGAKSTVCPPGETSAPAVGPASSAKTTKPLPTKEEAHAFLEQVDKDLHRIYAASSRAQWTYETYINEDTQALAASARETGSEYMTRTIKQAARFDAVKRELSPDDARQLTLLKVAETVPAPSDPAERAELAQISTSMTGAYGKGEYCPAPGGKLGGKCYHLDDLERILSTSKNEAELLDAWVGWHGVAKQFREKYPRYVELGNKGASEIGFRDMGALWRAGYDMPAPEFESDIERLWQEVKPLYDDLHCYVRGRLRGTYGKDKVRDKAPIPAHLLTNMWAQDWSDLLATVAPYKEEPPIDATKKLVEQKYDAVKMVKLGEQFFTSLGFDPLPETFWKRSLLVRPRDREVVCHASAWDVSYDGDLRIKMCIEPIEQHLIVIHHELGHDFYYQRYSKLPVLFQQGANDGFHEGIGDTLALTVTPEYLKKIGLLDQLPKGDKGRINQQMKMALGKVAFLPFGYLIDKWRWDVFSGKTPKEKYNEAWWALKTKYQGVARPLPGTEDDFDPGAKYHVASSTPYIRYFLAAIYQFQFHRALCKVAGYTGPIDQCSFFGNKAAGDRLIAMLSMGASKPWQEALAVLSGETKADAKALLDYFAPLHEWLKQQNKNEQCGW